MRSFYLFATGLGLMFSSPKAIDHFKIGGNYTEHDQDPVVAALFRGQLILLLATGSPELDYLLYVHDGGIPAAVEGSLRESIDVGLEVGGGGIVVRDGYDLMNWDPDDQSAVLIPIEDGYYRLRIGWEPSTEHAQMVLHVHPVKTEDRIPGEATRELIYSAF